MVAQIGAGASAQVFLADDLSLGRRVAVKCLRSGLSDDARFVKRFRAEATAAAQLSHPNLLAVYDWDESSSSAYIVTEVLLGGSLLDLIDRQPLSPSQALLVALQVTQGLKYAHSIGWVHRDIKPANLLFGQEGRLRIADFGIARAVAEAAWTEPEGVLVGTARYAAPEQAEGDAIDGKADIYSLALTIVEAVTGRVPLLGENALATMVLRQDRNVDGFEELGTLGKALAGAGSADPRARPTAAQLIENLTRTARSLPRPQRLPLSSGPPRFTDPTGEPDGVNDDAIDLRDESDPRIGAPQDEGTAGSTYGEQAGSRPDAEPGFSVVGHQLRPGDQIKSRPIPRPSDSRVLQNQTGYRSPVVGAPEAVPSHGSGPGAVASGPAKPEEGELGGEASESGAHDLVEVADQAVGRIQARSDTGADEGGAREAVPETSELQTSEHESATLADQASDGLEEVADSDDRETDRVDASGSDGRILEFPDSAAFNPWEWPRPSVSSDDQHSAAAKPPLEAPLVPPSSSWLDQSKLVPTQSIDPGEPLDVNASHSQSLHGDSPDSPDSPGTEKPAPPTSGPDAIDLTDSSGRHDRVSESRSEGAPGSFSGTALISDNSAGLAFTAKTFAGSPSPERTAEPPKTLASSRAPLPKTDPPAVRSPSPSPTTELRASKSPAAESPVMDSSMQTPASPILEPPILESPILESPTIESPFSESPFSESSFSESPTIESPVVELPVVESLSASSQGSPSEFAVSPNGESPSAPSEPDARPLPAPNRESSPEPGTIPSIFDQSAQGRGWGRSTKPSRTGPSIDLSPEATAAVRAEVNQLRSRRRGRHQEPPRPVRLTRLFDEGAGAAPSANNRLGGDPDPNPDHEHKHEHGIEQPDGAPKTIRMQPGVTIPTADSPAPTRTSTPTPGETAAPLARLGPGTAFDRESDHTSVSGTAAVGSKVLAEDSVGRGRNNDATIVPPNEAAPRQRPQWLAMVVLICLILLMIGAVMAIAVRSESGTETESSASTVLTTGAVAGDYVGGPAADAEADAERNNWLLSITEERRAGTEAGEVIEQEPKAGSSLADGDRLSLVVSLGAELHTVPAIMGRTVEEATLILERADLGVGEVTEIESDDDEGLVIELEVDGDEPDARLEAGTAIDLVVSAGPSASPMPSFVGLSVSRAIEQANDLGLELRQEQAFSERYDEGFVVHTEPPTDTAVEPGDTVTIVVSRGVPFVAVPDVVGMLPDEAAAELAAAGFGVATSGSPDQPVLATDPKAGDAHRKGRTITIITGP